MARARTLKPKFFSNVDLCELSPYHRLLFAGLWCWADREGRLIDRPKQIKHDILPFDEDCEDVDSMLTDLQEHGFIKRYISESKGVIEIINFEKHQNPHPKEQPSDLPSSESPVIPRQDQENKLHAGLFPIPSIPSIPSVALPPADPSGSSRSTQLKDLDLEDPITVFLSNAYRRNGRPRPKLTRRQDQPLLQRLEESESKNGTEFFRQCLLGFLATEDGWLRENGWPIARFLQNPEAWYREDAGGSPPSDLHTADEHAAEEWIQPPTDVASKAAVSLNWLDEWNRLVPEQPTEYNSKKNLLLKVESAGPEFRDNFEKITDAAKAVIAKDGAKASYLTLYWLCSYKDGEQHPNWWRLLFGDLRNMAVSRNGKSNSGQAWKPGMVIETPEHHKAYVAWKKVRKAAGLHTDPERAATEKAAV